MGVQGIKTKDEFEKAINSDTLVVADFYATWCGPCKQIAPKLEAWSKLNEYGDVIFIKVDVDELEDLAAEYGISAMPTFLLFRKGEKVDSFMGANVEKLKAMMDKHKGSCQQQAS